MTRTARIVDTDACGAPILAVERWLVCETGGGRVGQRFCGVIELAEWIDRLAPLLATGTWWCADRFPDPP